VALANLRYINALNNNNNNNNKVSSTTRRPNDARQLLLLLLLTLLAQLSATLAQRRSYTRNNSSPVLGRFPADDNRLLAIAHESNHQTAIHSGIHESGGTVT